MTDKSDSGKFGSSALKHFLFAKDFVNLNHGSFGTYPATVRNMMRNFQDQVESRPDPFIRYDYPVLLDESRDEVSQLLNVAVNDVVFVPNATTGVNTVLRNLDFAAGDVIIYFATIYGACEKTVTYITETTPAEAYKITYQYPISDSVLTQKFEKAIADLQNDGKNPRVAIFDTVVSMPGVRVPFEKLVQICHKENVLSLMDAAHGVGMLSSKELDLGKLQPDFFVSNCHKWLFVPRGCAVLYAAKQHQEMMRSTLPTSHGFQPKPQPGIPPVMNPLPASVKPPFVANFEFVGTIDNAPYLCLPKAVQFRKEHFGGEDAISSYLFNLARRSGDIVSGILGTEVLENEEGTLQNCAFSNVRLPLDPSSILKIAQNQGIDLSIDTIGGHIRDWMSLLLMKEYRTFMALMWYGSAWWVRLSAQVYLEEANFETAGEILLEACERVKKGEFLTPHERSRL